MNPLECLPALCSDLETLLEVDACFRSSRKSCLRHELSHVVAIDSLEWTDWDSDEVSTLFVSPSEEMWGQSSFELKRFNERGVDEEQVDVVRAKLL